MLQFGDDNAAVYDVAIGHVTGKALALASKFERTGASTAQRGGDSFGSTPSDPGYDPRVLRVCFNGV
jgi:hypothetical protein